MLLRLRKDPQPADLEALLALARELGYEPHFLGQECSILELCATETTPAELLNTRRAGHRSAFEDCVSVAAVLDHSDARELTDRRPGARDTVVKVGDAVFGAGAVSIVAGPCAVEDEARLQEIAMRVAAQGAVLLRGGAFKPRTSPYSFQGLGVEGLAMLARAREASGLGIVTEVLDPRDVEPVAQVADMLQIGSRSMANAALLREAGRSGKPVVLKRGMAASVREFLLAAEYVLAEGNDQVVLCERGIRGFDSATRNVLDLGSVALLKRTTHLPVIVDPSHAAGTPELVAPLARAAIAVGADGLIVEVHPAPAEVRSDAAQALSFDGFTEVVRSARAIVELDGRRLVRSKRPKGAKAFVPSVEETAH